MSLPIFLALESYSRDCIAHDLVRPSYSHHGIWILEWSIHASRASMHSSIEDPREEYETRDAIEWVGQQSYFLEESINFLVSSSFKSA